MVWQEVRKYLLKPETAKVMFAEAKEKALAAKQVNEADKIKRKLGGVTRQIEALAERIGQLPSGLDPKPLFEQLGKLQAAKSGFEEEFANKQLDVIPDEPISLEDFQKFTEGLRKLTEKEDDPVVRSHLIRTLVKRIDVHKDGIEIQFHVGQNHFLRELGDFKQSSGSRPFFVPKADPKNPKGSLNSPDLPPKGRTVRLYKYFVGGCSNTLTNGDPEPTTGNVGEAP